MAKIVLTAWGSGGDALPFVPIHQELRRRGHDVVLAVAPPVARALHSAGIGVTAVGPFHGRAALQRAGVLRPDGSGHAGLEAYWDLVLQALPRTAAELRPLVAGADLVVANLIHPAASLSAEEASVRWATLNINPSLLPSAATPPPGATDDAGPRTDQAWRELRGALRQTVDPAVNAARAAAGLSPICDAAFATERGVAVANLADEVFAPLQPDWPAGIRALGYPLWDRVEPSPDPEVEAFLDAGDPPVVLTLGTAVALLPEGFYDLAREVCHTLGRRAIVLGEASGRARTGGDVLARPYLPLSTLLPRAAAVVHHAGMGSVHAGLIAGCPAVAVPRCLDQAHNARRLVELGAGRALPWRDLEAATLTEQLGAVLQDATFAAQAAEHARRLASGPPPEHAAASAIEGWLTA